MAEEKEDLHEGLEIPPPPAVPPSGVVRRRPVRRDESHYYVRVHVGFLAALGLVCMIALAAALGLAFRRGEQVAERRKDDVAQRVVEKVTAPQGLAVPLPEPCDLAYIRKHNPDAEQRLKERNAEAAVQHKQTVAMFDGFVAQARALPVPRAILPSIPKAMAVTISGGAKVIVANKGPNGSCAWSFANANPSIVSVIPVGNSWRELAVMAGHELGDAKQEDPDEYVEQVNFISEGFLPTYWSLLIGYPEYTGADELTAGLKAWLKDVGTVRKLGAFAAMVAPLVLPDGQRDAVKAWLPDFWKASHADFAALEAAVAERDRAITATSDGYMDNYLYERQLKREGWFMRRWIAAGRGQAGARLIREYQRVMADLARSFGMPEAEAWARTLR